MLLQCEPCQAVAGLVYDSRHGTRLAEMDRKELSLRSRVWAEQARQRESANDLLLCGRSIMQKSWFGYFAKIATR